MRESEGGGGELSFAFSQNFEALFNGKTIESKTKKTKKLQAIFSLCLSQVLNVSLVF